MKASRVWKMPRDPLQHPVQNKERAMQAFAQHPLVRLMGMALLAWAVVWGTPPSAGAQEDPSRSPDMALVLEGEQYLCAPVDLQSPEAVVVWRHCHIKVTRNPSPLPNCFPRLGRGRIH